MDRINELKIEIFDIINEQQYHQIKYNELENKKKEKYEELQKEYDKESQTDMNAE